MLEQLYRENRTVMLQRALGILGDQQLAEDAVHDAFIRIARHIGRIKSMPSDERRYLCLTIVKNVALNMLRDRKETVELAETMQAVSCEVILGMDITAAINMLEEGHRNVVLLRLRYGFGTAETAKLLGIKQGTVRSRLNRARVFLREALK
ncbi:MAG: sigma-70 family RNA polymerase sigma factor [Oscillospiraceae bacterium]|nr:sigma-70 family RNA polymerase sigma factor [Oscillospiraceae bacterium]